MAQTAEDSTLQWNNFDQQHFVSHPPDRDDYLRSIYRGLLTRSRLPNISTGLFRKKSDYHRDFSKDGWLRLSSGYSYQRRPPPLTTDNLTVGRSSHTIEKSRASFLLLFLKFLSVRPVSSNRIRCEATRQNLTLCMAEVCCLGGNFRGNMLFSYE